ncbi:MAG: histidine phosphatase family protein [Nitrospirota bacterium]
MRARYVIVAWLAVSLAVVAAPVEAAEPSGLEQTGLHGAELVRALRNGGHVIYLRHAATDHSRGDSDRENLENCAEQRNLSDKGRDQAHAIGRAFKALGIPVARVESSPYCRCIETGRLAFGDVSVSDDLRSAISQSRSETARSAEALRKRLGEPPPPGTNTVLVSHTANLQEAAGIWPDPEGVAIVVRPDDAAGFSFVAKVLPEQWAELPRER